MISQALLVFFAFLVGGVENGITGWVADSSGNALPGVSISIRLSGQDSTRSTVSDSDGLFSVSGLSPGEYQIVATLSGFRTGETAVFVRHRGTASVAIMLDLEEPKDVLVCCCFPLMDERPDDVLRHRLRVRDAAERPLAGSRVVVSGDKTLELVTDADGLVEFLGTRQELKRLVITHEGYRPFSSELCCVDENVVLKRNDETKSGKR